MPVQAGTTCIRCTAYEAPQLLHMWNMHILGMPCAWCRMNALLHDIMQSLPVAFTSDVLQHPTQSAPRLASHPSMSWQLKHAVQASRQQGKKHHCQAGKTKPGCFVPEHGGACKSAGPCKGQSGCMHVCCQHGGRKLVTNSRVAPLWKGSMPYCNTYSCRGFSQFITRYWQSYDADALTIIYAQGKLGWHEIWT